VTEYLVTFAASARKELKDLPLEAVGRLLPKIRELAGNPRPVGCKKLQGYTDRWRIRAGNYRVVYAIDDGRKVVDITRIAHRKEAYER
jgi:mRNA interferase RelE/StbE